MQESRLFKIVYYLLDKGKSTAPELAEKFEVSIRTIYRDLDAISAAGIPIYAMQGKGGGISLLQDYILDKSLLSDQEKEKILMALQGIIATEDTKADELLSKLGGIFQTKIQDWIEVDFSDWIKNTPNQDVFNTIKGAIFTKNTIKFSYFGSNGSFSKRTAEPIKLVFKSKDWYLYGFCLLKNDFRFFKLTRIKDLEVLAETFTRDVPHTHSMPFAKPFSATKQSTHIVNYSGSKNMKCHLTICFPKHRLYRPQRTLTLKNMTSRPLLLSKVKPF